MTIFGNLLFLTSGHYTKPFFFFNYNVGYLIGGLIEHILSQTLYNSKQLALKQLLDNALKLTYKLWAKNVPYEHKDLLRTRKYRWNVHSEHSFKAWCIELTEH